MASLICSAQYFALVSNASQDDQLRAAVFRHGGKKWKAIAAMVPQRSPAQCNARWSQLQNLDDAVKTSWTAQEDARMGDLVATYGPGRWAVISSCMPGRNGKQCRERCGSVSIVCLSA